MSVENPYKKRKPKLAPKPVAKPRYGLAQEVFISSTRTRVDGDSKFFEKCNWCRITHNDERHKSPLISNGKTSVEAFYVKDMAVWLPNRIAKGYRPTCPKCKSKNSVEEGVKWVEHPKTLYGINNHRYFDTKYYHCSACVKKFTGWHPETMAIDAAEVTGVLNFRMSKGFAVDQELCSFITVHASDTTAQIFQRLKRQHADKWMYTATFYYRAVLAQQVRTTKFDVFKGSNQRTLDRNCFRVQQQTEAQKRYRRDRDELNRVTANYKALKTKAEADVHFVDIFNLKKNRNSSGLPFKGIGREKCMVLIDRGILTARDLLDYDGNDPAILPSWQCIVENYYDMLKIDLANLRRKKEKLEDELALEEVINGAENDGVITNNNSTGNNSSVTEEAAVEKAPSFSSLTDPWQYNCRVVSKSTIDRIKLSDYQRRRSLQLSKMRAIPAKIWKIDFGYKLAGKIKVYNGKGKPFSPHKSIVNVQNEDALTIFWKAHPGAEGVEVMKKDLVQLNKRNQRLGSTTLLTHVDNCCQVRGKLQQIVPGMLVKLDNFHWGQRWDPIMFDLQSEKTTIFRTMMRRAVFVIENSELERAKAALLKKKKTCTPHEVFKAAKATMPPPEELEARVMAVIHCVMEKDLEIDLANTENPEKPEKRFFKASPLTLNTINNQMQHVRNGCLSDPPASFIKIHRINEKTGKVYSARSTGSVEVCWRCLHHMLDTPSISFTRAEQTINNYFEMSNDRKKVTRLGQEAEVTTRTEQLQALHAMASRCGFKDSDIPVTDPNLTFPVALDDLEEHIGFECCLPKNFNVDVVQEEACDDDSDGSTDSLADYLRDIDFGDEEEDDGAQDDVTLTNEQGRNNTDYEPNDVFATKSDVDISIYVPEIVKNQSAYANFSRATKEQPWVPFRSQRDASSFNEVDNEEMSMFDEMRESYDRHAKRLDSGKGYKTFAKAWNLRVANLYKAKLDGMKVTVVNRKSYVQLQQHCDDVERHKELQALSRKRSDPAMQRMEDVFRTTRRAMAPHQEAVICDPIDYNNIRGLGRPQFGVPLALNTEITANAFEYTQNGAAIIYRRPNNQLATAQPITRDALTSSFNARTHCWRCGCQRKTHLRLSIPFGDGCYGNCLHDECSKCCERVEDYHMDRFIGPHCPKATSSKSQVAHKWYKEKDSAEKDNASGTI